MSNALAMLESLGSDASLRHASAGTLRQALPADAADALLAAARGEVEALYSVLGIAPASRFKNHVTLQHPMQLPTRPDEGDFIPDDPQAFPRTAQPEEFDAAAA